LIDTAWSLFGGSLRGWPLVQAIVSHVSQHIQSRWTDARFHKTALDAHQEGLGVVSRPSPNLAICFPAVA